MDVVQVAGTVAVTRVQPRVLTPDSIEGLAAKLESWCATVKEVRPSPVKCDGEGAVSVA